MVIETKMTNPTAGPMVEQGTNFIQAKRVETKQVAIKMEQRLTVEWEAVTSGVQTCDGVRQLVMIIVLN